MSESSAAYQKRRQFLAEFGGLSGDTVRRTVMAELRAQSPVLRALNLSVPDGAKTLWGLLVLCEHGVWFHVPASESAFTRLARQAAHHDAPVAQTVCLHSLADVRFALPARGRLWFLLPGSRRTLCMSFTATSGSTCYATFSLTERAATILPQLRLS